MKMYIYYENISKDLSEKDGHIINFDFNIIWCVVCV